MSQKSAGARFRHAVENERPLQIVGTINAYSALQAEQVGYQAIYLSGAGVANASYGIPDLGITNLNDVLADVRRITSVTNTPLLVDIDTGWGNAFGIARTIKAMISAGVAAVHIEDQVQAKRCGHRPGKALVSSAEMTDRLKAAVDARTDHSFVIMARTDAAAVEGVDEAIERAQNYVDAGADMIFAEALKDLSHYKKFTESVNVPVLANITEFGQTPYFTKAELHNVGIRLVLYPLSAFRAMNAAALKVYQTIRQEGTQKSLVDIMQTRDKLYETLNYYSYEEKLDELFGKEK